MIFIIDRNSPAVIRILPVQPLTLSIHNLKNKSYACSRLKDKTPCPVCDMRNNLYKDAEEAESDKTKRECNEFARNLRPLERHYFPIIDRAYPDKGVQILVASKSLAQIIYKGVIEHPCPPTEPKWYHFWTRLKQWYTRYKRPTSALDEREGVDFIVRREMKRLGTNSFADYTTSTYAKILSPIHTDPKQIVDWKTQAEALLKKIDIPSTTELSTTHAPV
jgi:hypothetical protein